MSTILNVVTDTLGARLSFARRLRKRVPTRIPENVSGGDDDVLRRLMRASSRAMPSKKAVMHIFVSTRGSLYWICDGTRLCTNCARIQRFHTARDSFERKADSPICWKR